jgi:2,4-dienoyl-CoA reductase-like NADH-dependent reductase (Old Yellow Enzyme family)
MSATATVEVIAAVRAQFGPDFVPARLSAEEQVRTFLNEQLGVLDANESLPSDG